MQKNLIHKLIVSIMISIMSVQEISAQDSANADRYGSDWKYLGYSAVLPGLGEYLKDNRIEGLKTFGIFLLSYGLLDNSQRQAASYRKSYFDTAFVTAYMVSAYDAPLHYSALLIFSMDKGYHEPYKHSKDRVNEISSFLGLFYVYQMLIAFGEKPGTEKEKQTEKAQSLYEGLDLSIRPERTVFGKGTDIQLSWRGRF